MNDDPARHRIPDRAVLYKRRGTSGHLRRLAIHVEVHRVVHDRAALAELTKFHPLDLVSLATLPHDSVSAEEVAGAAVGGWSGKNVGRCRRVAIGHDLDAPGQQSDCGASVGHGDVETKARDAWIARVAEIDRLSIVGPLNAGK